MIIEKFKLTIVDSNFLLKNLNLPYYIMNFKLNRQNLILLKNLQLIYFLFFI